MTACYYDLPQSDILARRLDPDLGECLGYHIRTFTLDDIEQVLAVWEGQNEGDDWRWVLKLRDGRFAFVQGGCDYTGWSCQSWGTSDFANTAEDAAKMALGDVPIGESHPANLGLGRSMAILCGGYPGDLNRIHQSLLEQLSSGKLPTWKETMAEDFGYPQQVDLDQGFQSVHCRAGNNLVPNSSAGTNLARGDAAD